MYWLCRYRRRLGENLSREIAGAGNVVLRKSERNDCIFRAPARIGRRLLVCFGRGGGNRCASGIDLPSCDEEGRPSHLPLDLEVRRLALRLLEVARRLIELSASHERVGQPKHRRRGRQRLRRAELLLGLIDLLLRKQDMPERMQCEVPKRAVQRGGPRERRFGIGIVQQEIVVSAADIVLRPHSGPGRELRTYATNRAFPRVGVDSANNPWTYARSRSLNRPSMVNALSSANRASA